MLDKDRIKKAESNVKVYLSDGKLKRIRHKEPRVKNILVQNSRESLKVAEILFKNDYSYLWTIVCSYYSMYYIAKAIIYEYNFEVKHQITVDPIENVF